MQTTYILYTYYIHIIYNIQNGITFKALLLKVLVRKNLKVQVIPKWFYF